MASNPGGRGQEEQSQHRPIETGSFSLQDDGTSEFIGSASGVFFINTVLKAFAKKVEPSQQLAATLDEDSPASFVLGHRTVLNPQSAQQPSASPANCDGDSTYSDCAKRVKALSSMHELRDLVMLYFKHWHPHFPFLNGPAFIEDMESILEEISRFETLPRDRDVTLEALCKIVTLHCVLLIATKSRPGGAADDALSAEIHPSLLDKINFLSQRPTMASIQALLSMALSFIVHMSLRSASLVNGALVRTIYHSGLHRCPVRYVALSSSMCALRKRIFWSAYVMDRFISQSLGVPFGLHDAEIDVCLPASQELHVPLQPADGSSRSDDTLSHLPRTHPDHVSSPNGQSARIPAPNFDAGLVRLSSNAERPLTESILFHRVRHSQLLGEILSLLHSSIHARSVTDEKLKSLKYRTTAWWHSLPKRLQHSGGRSRTGEENEESQNEQPRYDTQFSILHNYLLLLLNRPFLSSLQNGLAFNTAIQEALSASRCIAHHLRTASRDAFLLAWPMTLSAAWMGGLVIAFACLLDLYPLETAKSEIVTCVSYIRQKEKVWHCATICRATLQSLLACLDRIQSGVAFNSADCEVPGGRFQPSTPDDLERSILVPRSVLPTSNRSVSDARGPSLKRPRTSRPVNPRLSSMTAPDYPIPAASVPYFPQASLTNQIPVLQYRGPDFGFDTSIRPQEDEQSELYGPVLDPYLNGLFTDEAWVSYLGGIGQG